MWYEKYWDRTSGEKHSSFRFVLAGSDCYELLTLAPNNNGIRLHNNVRAHF